MARTNTAIKSESRKKVFTHEGAPAVNINAEKQLRRSVMACLLWENTFYEEGVEIAKRIQGLIKECSPHFVATLAIEAREDMKLRHIPLFIVREMARLETHKHLVAETLERVIQRADELAEFLAIYWKEGKTPISNQVKKGLAKAFVKFNEYQLAKYNRDNAIKLRDVLFLVHAKPETKEQAKLWKKLIDNKLEIPDTWEVAISAAKGNDAKVKKEWARLLKEEQLGALALLRNLRNMEQAGVARGHIKEALEAMKTERVLPYRFIAAAKHAPEFESDLEKAMFKCVEIENKLKGTTCLLVDVSGSMDGTLSAKSDLKRKDAACGLAILLRELCEDIQVVNFGDRFIKLPARRGFALRDCIMNTDAGGSTDLGGAVEFVKKNLEYNRIIVITDEQSQTKVGTPGAKKAYMINVAAYKNGVGYGQWNHLDGFSEAVVKWIQEFENENNNSIYNDNIN